MVARNSLQRALKAHQSGNHDKAGQICDTILKNEPHNFDALHLSGLVAFEIGNLEEARKLIDQSLMISPSQPSALNNFGNVLRKLNETEKAQEAYRLALRLQPQFADAWANLATIYHDMEQPERALEMVNRAIDIDPDHAIALHTLGFLLLEGDDVKGAAAAFEKCTRFALPRNLTPVWYAKILINFDMLEEAGRILLRWQKQYPDDEVAGHYLDAISGNHSTRASEDAVRGTFDNFAASFDRILLKNLEYKAPELVGDAVRKLYNEEKSSLVIADLGCGTGLMAPLLRPLAKSLVGIDLSGKMLQKAESRGGYDELLEVDLVKFLNGRLAGDIDLITCVDTLCYLGDLSDTLDAVRHALKSGGYFVATVEEMSPEDDSPPYRLDLTGRFSHRRDYVSGAIEQSGLALVDISNVVLRKEAGKPVNGLLIVATH